MSFQAIIDELHEAVGASRTTLRLDAPDAVFPVAAERCAPGIESIVASTGIDLRAAPTFRFLERERRNLIQDDCAAAPDAPPAALLAHYGVKAQMLAPIVVDDRLVGIVSVHYAPSTRNWTDHDVALLDGAAARVTAELTAG